MKQLIALLILVTVIGYSTSFTIKPKDELKKLVCYFDGWAIYRPGNGQFDVRWIDPFLCTHVIYGIAGLLESNNTIQCLDPKMDCPSWGGGYLAFTQLKKINPTLKTILAIGGWNEGSVKYSKMVSDQASRAVFIESVVELLQKYNFDGLDFDWKFPANRGGSPDDKVNFIKLSSELKEAFAPHGLMLTAAVSTRKAVIDTGYDVPAMSRIFDQIHIMTYDFHGPWQNFTSHNAPLFGNPNIESGDQLHLNVDFAVKNWIANGASPSKLILGMPLYGRGFILSDENKHGLYEPAYQAIPAGPYTSVAGIWGYNEICERFAADPGWTIVRDSYYQAPYAYKGNLWIGYDDQESFKAKAEYAMSMNLGGAMVWSMATDDFHGICDGKPFSLIKTIKEAMNGIIVPTTNVPSTVNPSSEPTNIPSVRTTTNNPLTTSSHSFECKADGVYADPNDCALFHQCVGNNTGGWINYTSRCMQYTVFNPTTDSCDWPMFVPGCENYYQ